MIQQVESKSALSTQIWIRWNKMIITYMWSLTISWTAIDTCCISETLALVIFPAAKIDPNGHQQCLIDHMWLLIFIDSDQSCKTEMKPYTDSKCSCFKTVYKCHRQMDRDRQNYHSICHKNFVTASYDNWVIPFWCQDRLANTRHLPSRRYHWRHVHTDSHQVPRYYCQRRQCPSATYDETVN